MAGRAAERVRQEFALGTIVARHAALYAELIDRSAKSRLKNDGLKREPGRREACS
jgi:hypothetical protein